MDGVKRDPDLEFEGLGVDRALGAAEDRLDAFGIDQVTPATRDLPVESLMSLMEQGRSVIEEGRAAHALANAYLDHARQRTGSYRVAATPCPECQTALVPTRDLISIDADGRAIHAMSLIKTDQPIDTAVLLDRADRLHESPFMAQVEQFVRSAQRAGRVGLFLWALGMTLFAIGTPARMVIAAVVVGTLALISAVAWGTAAQESLRKIEMDLADVKKNRRRR